MRHCLAWPVTQQDTCWHSLLPSPRAGRRHGGWTTQRAADYFHRSPCWLRPPGGDRSHPSRRQLLSVHMFVWMRLSDPGAQQGSGRLPSRAYYARSPAYRHECPPALRFARSPRRLPLDDLRPGHRRGAPFRRAVLAVTRCFRFTRTASRLVSSPRLHVLAYLR